MSKCGGVLPGDERDVMNYQPPQGPKHIMDTGVGLRGGTNVGNAGSQGKYSANGDGASGRVGIGGENIGNRGTQGRR